jgi:signal transduction histidine kinase
LIRFLTRRFAQLIPVALAIASLNFVLLHLAPGDAADIVAGQAGHATPEFVAQLRRDFGLDRPLYEQYLIYVVRLVTFDLGHSFVYQRPVAELILERLPPTLILMLAALVLAVEVVERRRTEAELLTAEEERHRAERDAIMATATERQRVAGDIHDTIGHALNVVILQAGAARRTLDQDAELTRELLESIEDSGRSAFRELDMALGLIERDGGGPGLDAVPQLVDTLRSAGLLVELAIDPDGPALPTVVDRSAYRVVQESLTNVAKHAPEASAVVRVHREPRWLVVCVTDDGWRAASVPAPPGGGRGLLGLGERVAVLGGQLDCGPRPGGGFRVQATFPIPGRTA